MEEKQQKMEKQLEIDRLKLEKAQKELEEERAALAKERVRVYASEKSSRAESGIGMTEVKDKTINCIITFHFSQE